MSHNTPPNPPRVTHLPTRETPTINTTTTAMRWQRLADEIAEHARQALADTRVTDEVRQRVGLLVVREALALGVSTDLREARP